MKKTRRIRRSEATWRELFSRSSVSSAEHSSRKMHDATAKAQELFFFYNCAAGEGARGFKPLVEKYGILKHLNYNLLADPTLKKECNLYAASAF